jgi:type IV pilus biogenesis protein CpaD/CtpE
MPNPARAACAAAMLSLLALSGCDKIDPLTRPYVWVPTNVNPHNIAAMAVNPSDLVRGRESKNTRAIEESDAVEHLWSGHPAALLSGGGGASAAATPPAGGS